ncbi:MAG: hypothetical protein HY661_14640 [Betaproteobacteria bacterium]|nr:hypothetical protein [Betaproteobacteria bacterium]
MRSGIAPQGTTKWLEALDSALAIAAMTALVTMSVLAPSKVSEAISKYGIDPEKSASTAG